MVPTKTKPLRRRRLLVVALLLLVSAISWWYWPRGDARFVGKWHHSNPVAVPPIEFTIEFRDDGSGTIWAVNHDPHLEADLITTPIRWWVSGNELLWTTLGANDPSRLRIVRVTDRQILWQRHTDDSDSAPLALDRAE
jgi:hypothetical protein